MRFHGRQALRQPLFYLVRTDFQHLEDFLAVREKSQWANSISIVLFSANMEGRLASMASRRTCGVDEIAPVIRRDVKGWGANST